MAYFMPEISAGLLREQRRDDPVVGCDHPSSGRPADHRSHGHRVQRGVQPGRGTDCLR
jgi:hypothetical protein